MQALGAAVVIFNHEGADKIFSSSKVSTVLPSTGTSVNNLRHFTAMQMAGAAALQGMAAYEKVTLDIIFTNIIP